MEISGQDLVSALIYLLVCLYFCVQLKNRARNGEAEQLLTTKNKLLVQQLYFRHVMRKLKQEKLLVGVHMGGIVFHVLLNFGKLGDLLC